jgi:hypothetical protein
MANNRPFVVDAALTAIAIGYRNAAVNLIADRVLPRVMVGGEKFKWLEYPLAESFTVPNTLVGRKGRPNQIEFTAVERTDSVDDYGLDDPIPNSDIKVAADQRVQGLSVYDPEARGAEGLTDLIVLDREVRVAAIVQDPARYDASRRITLSGTSQFSDHANSNPLQTMLAALDATITMRPNKVIMGRSAWTPLRQHPHLVNAVKGGNLNRGSIRPEDLADLLEVNEVIIGEGFVNTARKGQAVNLQRIWGKSIAMIYQDPTAGPDRGLTWGYTAQYGTRIAGRIEDPNIGLEGGSYIRVGERVKEIVCAPGVGYLIQNAVA